MKTKLSNHQEIDRIHKQSDGKYRDQSGRLLDIKEVFNTGRLYCFSGKNHPLIVAEWNVVGAMFVVIGDYLRG